MNRLNLTFLLVLFVNTSFAQDWFSVHSKNDILDGHIIGIAGDTIRGYIQYDYPLVMQKSVLFFESIQDQNPRLYEPDDIRGYSTTDKWWISTKVIMNTYNGTFTFNRFGIVESMPGPLVLLRIFDEPDKLKKKLNSQEAETLHQKIQLNKDPGSIKNIYIKKNEESAIAIFNKDFKKSFVEKIQPYVGDNMDLLNKIVNKERKIREINKIVNEYNRWYVSKYFD